MNQITLIGNVGKDPEIKEINGHKCAKLTIATTKTYKQNGEKKVVTTWHNVAFWGPLAKVVEDYVKKGQKLMVQGEQTFREYEKDGAKHLFAEVNANNIEMLSKSETKQEIQLVEAEEVFTPESLNDLPF